MRKVIVLLSAAAVLMFAGSVFGQLNWSGEPYSGTHTLNSGFVPDPYMVPVTAGGPTDVSALGIMDPTGGFCAGNVDAARPDVRLHYTAGAFNFLRFYVQSTADTTLIVNMPDASNRCNDDAVGLNPMVDIPNPPTGQYDVWVGTFWTGQPSPATLNITELTTNQPRP